jgi:hypothetical protein
MSLATSHSMPHYSRRKIHLRRWLIGGLMTALSVILTPVAAKAQNVLVWSTGNQDGSTTGVAAWLQASGQFTSVTGIDSPTTMTLPQLLAYDRVFYFSSTNGANDPVAIGDVLANYADTGRRLVLATFCWANQGTNTLSGRIITDQLSPYVLQGGSLYTPVTIQSHDGSHFFDGVNAIDGYFHDNVALTPGATGHALWSDGSSLLATKGNVVAVNLFPDDFWASISGDYRPLFVNALLPIPEPSTLLLATFTLCGVTARRPRRRQFKN